MEPYEEVITDTVLPLGAVGPWWWWPIITGFTLGSLFNNNVLYKERYHNVLSEPVPVEVHVVALHLFEVKSALLVQGLEAEPVLPVEGERLQLLCQDVLNTNNSTDQSLSRSVSPVPADKTQTVPRVLE